MKTERYKIIFRDQCLRIFDSNIEKYFAARERTHYEKYLNDRAEQCPYFVILEGNNVVACGGYEVHNGKGWLSWGMVNQSRHGENIGKLLLQHRIEDMKANYGHVSIVIETSQHTQGFYSKFGFNMTKIEKDGYKEGLDKVYMEYRAAKC